MKRKATLDSTIWKCPTRLQMEAVECGAAALAMILAHFGRDVPLTELREQLGVSRSGSSAAAILRGARHYGLDGQGLSVDATGLRRLRGPVIAFWNNNHFVVVEGHRRGRWLVNNPALGGAWVSDEEFEHSFSRVVITFERTDRFVEAHTRTVDYLRKLGRPLTGSRSAVLFAISAGFAEVVPTLVLSFLAGVFVSQILGAEDTSLLGGLVTLMVVMAVISTALAYLKRAVFIRLEITLTMKLEMAYLRHLLRLPVTYFTERGAGQLTSRMAVNRSIAGLLAGQVATALLSCLTALVYGAVLVLLQPALAGVVAVLAVAEVVLLKTTAALRTSRAQQSLQMQMAFGGISLNGLRSIEMLKARGAEDEFFQTWVASQTGLINAKQRFGVPVTVMASSRSLLKMAENLTVLVLGGLLVLDGRMTVGALVTFSLLTSHFLAPIVNLSRVAGILQTSRAAVDQLGDVLDHPIDPEVVDRPLDQLDQLETRGTRVRQLSGLLEVKDVTFGYDRDRPPLIERLSFTLPVGGRVALVGRSGCGKSTIANLVAGLYAPWSGEILFDGHTRDDLARAVLTSSVAKVDPDFVLFSGTVRDDLRFWDPSVDESRLVAAARDASIHDEIVRRPGGYGARVAEYGQNFSGGEAQRIEIARSLTTNPTLLILDEATSALDPETEQQIDLALRRRGLSCLVIAHRLSTIRDCDEIIVLDKGRVIQRGTHDQLIAVEGEYRTLVGEA